MAGDRRRQLVDAGVALAVRQRFQDLLSGVDTRSITEAAGVTTGSFFHHFANRGEFAEAVAERFEVLWQESVDALAVTLQGVADGEVSEVRGVAQHDWERVADQDAVAVLMHLLWAAHHGEVRDGGGQTGADVLRRAYRYLLDQTLPAYRGAVEAMGREMLPPFEVVDVAVVLTALADGLQMREAVQPEVVRPSLFADVVTAALVSMTRPTDELGELDLAALEGQLAPRAQPRGPAVATWRHIVDAAAPLFDERPLEQVKVADIAKAAGVSPSTVYHQFRRPSAVAAAGWVRHLPALGAVASRSLTSDEGPLRRSEEVMGLYIELGRTHRSALEALMIEAVAAWRGPDRDPVAQRVLQTVPISDLLVPHLRELRVRGRLRRRVSLRGLARTIVFLVSMRTLAMPDDPTEQIIDDSLGLVMDGALAAGTGGVRRPHRPVPAPRNE